jgi:hypothetical protein
VIAGAIGGIVASLIHEVLRAVRGMEEQHFGFCTGSRGPSAGPDSPALTDWLHSAIQRLAGLPLDRPLTFADLAEQKIDLRIITSNLTLAEPYVLPDERDDFLYSVRELSPYFPPTVMKALAEAAPQRRMRDPELEQDLRRLALGDAMPVIVAVRLSLSFPFLLSAIPVRRMPEGLDAKGVTHVTTEECERHIFSDGGHRQHPARRLRGGERVVQSLSRLRRGRRAGAPVGSLANAGRQPRGGAARDAGARRAARARRRVSLGRRAPAFAARARSAAGGE